MRRILLKISYIGTNYIGWQKQKQNDNSIQTKIEESILKAINEKVELVGSGRTDAGVHALCQYAHFDTNSDIPANKFSLIINQYLPFDISVKESFEVSSDFHCRFSAKKKTYLYNLYLSKDKNIFYEPFATQVYIDINIENMKEAAKLLIGYHNFKAFCSSKTEVIDFKRTIYSIKISKKSNMILIKITGNGFLYNMVRIIVGALYSVGIGQRSLEDIMKMLDSGERPFNIKTFPAKGLFLFNVNYLKKI